MPKKPGDQAVDIVIAYEAGKISRKEAIKRFDNLIETLDGDARWHIVGRRIEFEASHKERSR
jgi:hypothetical protein